MHNITKEMVNYLRGVSQDCKELIQKPIKESAQEFQLRVEKLKSFLDEAEKWAQKADVEGGKMHNVLGIPEDEKIEDHYDNSQKGAKKLVDDLYNKIGEEKEVAGMINYSANLSKGDNIFKKAQKALKKTDYSE